MAKLPEKLPGKFKEERHRAGSTLFVTPELVEGTLKKGFEPYQSLEVPFQRAVFIMFLVAAVHPFADGNGRVAHIMMNAELVAESEQRIIIPTIFRNNYLVALKALFITSTHRLLYVHLILPSAIRGEWIGAPKKLASAFYKQLMHLLILTRQICKE